MIIMLISFKMILSRRKIKEKNQGGQIVAAHNPAWVQLVM